MPGATCTFVWLLWISIQFLRLFAQHFIPVPSPQPMHVILKMHSSIHFVTNRKVNIGTTERVSMLKQLGSVQFLNYFHIKFLIHQTPF